MDNNNELNSIFPTTSKRRRRTLNLNDPIVQQLFAGVQRRTSLRTEVNSSSQPVTFTTDKETIQTSRRNSTPNLVEGEEDRRLSIQRGRTPTKPVSSVNLSHRFRVVQRPNTRRPRTVKKPTTTLSPHAILNNLLSVLPTTEQVPEDIPMMVRDERPRLSTISDKLDQVITEFNNSPLPEVENYFDETKDSSDSETSRRLSTFYDTTGELITNHHSKRLSDLNNVSLFSSSRDSLKMELDEAFNNFKQHTPESIGRISDVNLSVSDSSNILTNIISPQSEFNKTIPNPDETENSSFNFPEPFPNVDYTMNNILPDISDLNKTASSIVSHENTAATINPNELDQSELNVIPELKTGDQSELNLIPDSKTDEQFELNTISELKTDDQPPTSILNEEIEPQTIDQEDSQITRPDALDLPDMMIDSNFDPNHLDTTTMNSDRSSPSSSSLTTPIKYSPLTKQLDDDIYNGFDPFSLEEDPFLAQPSPPVKSNKFISENPTRATSLLKFRRAGFGVKAGVPRVSRGLRQRVKKTYKTKSGEDFQNLPDSLVSELANMSLNPGVKGPRLSSDCLDILHQATFQFFQQTSQSLTDYARHAGRRTIEYPDTELLFRRQKLLNDRNSMLTLLSQHLPQELVKLVEDRANPNPVKLSR